MHLDTVHALPSSWDPIIFFKAGSFTEDKEMLRWNIDSLQLWMTLAVVYFPTSAYLQLV